MAAVIPEGSLGPIVLCPCCFAASSQATLTDHLPTVLCSGLWTSVNSPSPLEILCLTLLFQSKVWVYRLFARSVVLV